MPPREEEATMDESMVEEAEGITYEGKKELMERMILGDF